MKKFICAIIALICVTITASAAAIAVDPDAIPGKPVSRTQEEIIAELNRKVRDGMITISMNTNPVFRSGEDVGDLRIVNSKSNNSPQVVYIVRKDNGKEIYCSDKIPVGGCVDSAKLSVDLNKGEYQCIAYFNKVDNSTGLFTGTACAEINITVLS